MLTTRVAGKFAERLEDKAQKRGLSVSSYLQQLVIADIENVRDRKFMKN